MKVTTSKGGYLFLQSIYYGLGFDRVCRKIREQHRFQYDLNAILSDLVYTRIFEPGNKRASYRAAMDHLEKPSYEEHDVYRAPGRARRRMRLHTVGNL